MKSVSFYAALILLTTLFACSENSQQASEETMDKKEKKVKENDEKVDLRFPAISPRSQVNQVIGVTDVRIDYSRPAVRERVVWGELVPYNEIWRTGANAPTTIKLQHDVMVNGNPVAAGKYSIITIPNENGNWKLMFHKDTEVNSSIGYDEANDALQLELQAESTDVHYEMMTFKFIDVTETSGTAVMAWENLQIEFDIEVNTHDIVLKKIDKAIKNADDDDWMVYSQSARYLVSKGERMEDAEKWINKSISIEENWRNYFAKANLREKQGDIPRAIELTEKALEAGRKDESFGAEGFLIGNLERLKSEI
ncbi:MAG: DUF2911 domain-containing protein [Chitinophagaceae bacterium]|nr:MAG: DUF2911 domain-containing protein [Chitinophagaceae bacterium]